eukprot:10658361-Alexandrium_andersonii.AAC.1
MWDLQGRAGERVLAGLILFPLAGRGVVSLRVFRSGASLRGPLSAPGAVRRALFVRAGLREPPSIAVRRRGTQA